MRRAALSSAPCRRPLWCCMAVLKGSAAWRPVDEVLCGLHMLWLCLDVTSDGLLRGACFDKEKPWVFLQQFLMHANAGPPSACGLGLC